MPDGVTQYEMSFPAPLSFDDRSTWLFTAPPQAAPAPPPSPPVSAHPHSPPAADVPMTEAPASPAQARASISAAATSHPTDPTLQDLYQLMSAMRATQLGMQATQIRHDNALYDIQYQLHEQSEQIGAIEEKLRDYRFYDEYGYYPGPSCPRG